METTNQTVFESFLGSRQSMQDEKRRPATLKLIEFANWFVCPELVSRTLKSCRLVGQSKRCFKWIFLPCRHFVHFTINAHFSICITCVDVLWRVCMTSHLFLLLYAATQDGKWRPWSQTAWLGSRLRAHTGKGTKAFPWNHQRLIMMNSTPFSQVCIQLLLSLFLPIGNLSVV